MMAIRSPRTSASSMECVVNKIILPFLIFLINCQVERIEYGSMPLVGSSRMITWKCLQRILKRNKGKKKGKKNGDNLAISNESYSKGQFPLHPSRKCTDNCIYFVSQTHLNQIICKTKVKKFNSI